MKVDITPLKKSDGSSIKYLVVDDSAFMRKNLIRIIKMMHGEVFEAEDGEEAVEMYKKVLPDIVTLDITMPRKNGMTALKEILEFDKNAVVVMVTAMGQQHIIEGAVKIGAKHFLVKPLKTSNVAYRLGKLLRKFSDAVYEE